MNDLYHEHFAEPVKSAGRWADAWDVAPALRPELDQLARLPEVWASASDHFRQAWQIRSPAGGLPRFLLPSAPASPGGAAGLPERPDAPERPEEDS